MAINLGELIKLYDVKEVGADVCIKISNDVSLHGSILGMERQIADTKTDKSYDIFQDNDDFKNLLYACKMDCYNTNVAKIDWNNNELTLTLEEGGGGNTRFEVWREMLRPLIGRDDGRIVIQNTRDNTQIVSQKLIDWLPDGEVNDWHIGNDGIFYIGVDLRIVNQKLVEEIAKYNAQFDRFRGNGGLRLTEQRSFNVTGNREIINKLEEIIENNRVGEYMKYNYCAIYTYVDLNEFDKISGLSEPEQIRLVEKSLRQRHPEVLNEIDIQQIIWTDSEKKAVQFRCRSVNKYYVDAPFDMYIKLTHRGISSIENRNLPRAVGDLNNRLWYLKLYE